MEYSLESVGIRSTNYAHICALLTLNKKTICLMVKIKKIQFIETIGRKY